MTKKSPQLAPDGKSPTIRPHSTAVLNLDDFDDMVAFYIKCEAIYGRSNPDLEKMSLKKCRNCG